MQTHRLNNSTQRIAIATSGIAMSVWEIFKWVKFDGTRTGTEKNEIKTNRKIPIGNLNSGPKTQENHFRGSCRSVHAARRHHIRPRWTGGWEAGSFVGETQRFTCNNNHNFAIINYSKHSKCLARFGSVVIVIRTYYPTWNTIIISFYSSSHCKEQRCRCDTSSVHGSLGIRFTVRVQCSLDRLLLHFYMTIAYCLHSSSILNFLFIIIICVRQGSASTAV